MLLEITLKEATKAVSGKEGWEYRQAVVTDGDGLLFWPIVNKEQGRLVLRQYYGSVVEVDVKKIGVKVSDENSLTIFLDLIVKSLPQGRKPLLKDFLEWAYDKYQDVFEKFKASIAASNNTILEN